MYPQPATKGPQQQNGPESREYPLTIQVEMQGKVEANKTSQQTKMADSG